MAENTAPRRETPRIEADDLTSDEPSAIYWKKLAESCQKNIDNYLEEMTRLKDQIYNLQEEKRSYLEEKTRLKEQICTLQEENRICKIMLDECRELVNVLQETVAEQNGSDETAETVQNN